MAGNKWKCFLRAEVLREFRCFFYLGFCSENYSISGSLRSIRDTLHCVAVYRPVYSPSIYTHATKYTLFYNSAVNSCTAFAISILILSAELAGLLPNSINLCFENQAID